MLGSNWKALLIRENPQCPLLLLWTFDCVGRASPVASCTEESAAGRNIWHFSVMTALLLLSFRTVCILSVWTHVSRGNTKSDLDDKYFPALECGLFWQTPPSLYSNWGPSGYFQRLFDTRWAWMYSSGTHWTWLPWSIRSSFLVYTSGAGTWPQRINVMHNPFISLLSYEFPTPVFIIWNLWNYLRWSVKV